MDCSNCKTISGPVNLARLENEKLNKVIYLFFDIHLNLEEQTNCVAISPTIDQYLDYKFKSLTKNDGMVDVFLEYSNESAEAYGKNNQRVGSIKNIKYIESLMLYVFPFVDKRFSENKTINEFVLVNKKIKYVRFHLFDYRYELRFRYICRLLHNLPYNFNQYYDKINIDVIHFLKDYLLNVIPLFKSPNKHFENKNIGIIKINYLLNKFRTKYNNKTIKKKLNGLLDKYADKLKDIVTKIIRACTSINKIHKEYNYISPDKINKNEERVFINFYNIKHDYILKLKKISIDLNILIDDFSAQIAKMTDLFLLKRFLDKDYITNSMTYTGSFHSVHLLYILIKYFDFKPTHFEYSKIKVDDLKNKIKEGAKLEEINYYLSRKRVYQCIDISKFPDLFT